ncbi:DegV family protein [Lachnospiraceae bacterium]|jgi:DegV family protein with EDD domain|nr:DegV family protein [uncultured Schaedlerella sp.]EOS41502.1 DegV family EDD domain-containing protein [Lachnospiraceae bacterium M18-1]MCI9153892.1 DegV family protein [Ruminococcus sp.]NBI60814.1 DegV family protein [Lachnospiraceae bacterium]
MSYKVIVDSCGELTEEMKANGNFETASLTMEVGGIRIIDDASFDQADFLRRVAECPESPKSSCPSPEDYMEKYRCEAERVYAVTLTAELSGSYNSAVLAKNLYIEEYGEKNIHIFNSRSASIGETLIAMKVQECEEAGMSFEQVVDTVERYIDGQHTYFVLENLDTLRKNGRLTGIKSLVAGALNIKPVMAATPEGTICQIGQARGIKKALSKMVDQIAGETQGAEEKILAISNCNCRERAQEVQRMLLSKMKVKASFIVDMAGISSMYGNDGGIIVVI